MITHEINMDLQFRGVAPVIDAVQGDSLSRSIKINLFSAGQPWEMPDGASAALRYRKTDGKGGIYSNLPDGTEAWEVDGNSVTILLINQVLNVPGAVVADMIIIQADSVLATFPLAIRVSPDPSADVVESDNYFGIPLDDTLTVSGAAADAAAVGGKVVALERRVTMEEKQTELLQQEAEKTDQRLQDTETLAQGAADMASDAAERLATAERNIHGLLQEIDNLLETTVVKSGDTMTGSLDLGGNTVTGLGDPADDTDAVPKGYLERRLEDFGGTGGGEAGGYYTPAVSQPEAGSMEISFDASSGEMPEVAPVLVALPQGEKGDTGPQGEKGDTGPQGEKGETGAPGADGAKGDKGDKGDTGATGAQGEPGKDGADGKDGTSATHSWNGTVLTITSASGTSSADLKGDKGDPGEPGVDGADYILTDADKTEIAEMAAELVEIPDSSQNVEIDTTLTQSGQAADAATVGERLSALSGELDNFIASGGFSAPIVDSVDEMVDTSKQYILKSTGTIWAYKSSTTEQDVTVTDEIEVTDANPYKADTRFGSPGDGFSAQSGYHITPLIDLTKTKYAGKTIQIHLEGAQYASEATYAYYIQCRIYGLDMTVLAVRPYTAETKESTAYIMGCTNGITVDYISETEATITIANPTYGSANIAIGYIRFSGKGAVADSHIYITYNDTQTVTSEQWVDTGIQYGSGGLDAETAAKISELNNEGEDPATIKLLPKPVLDFYNAAAYSDSDYSYSHLGKITYPCRTDIPVPYTVKWNHREDAMRTTVAVDTRAIGTVNAYTLRTYDATGLNKFPIYNLLPNKTYYYKVTHVLSDGSLVEAKSGSFTTSSEAWRLLYIDGTQNVRDLGGCTGLNGKKVKYGKIIRGAALNDSSIPELLLTGKGRRSLGELKIQAELNLGATDTETSIASNCVYKKIGYTNYAIAFTGETYRAQFKEVLEWIVECLNASKPIYMHCQGGCDRTGTLAFQLLGMLGVSESDLAKEYELSSFSDIGFGRLRTTTKAVDTYDYVGMVEALKAYGGATVADKFYDFATTGCGISADTITNFRNLMLE